MKLSGVGLMTDAPNNPTAASCVGLLPCPKCGGRWCSVDRCLPASVVSEDPIAALEMISAACPPYTHDYGEWPTISDFGFNGDDFARHNDAVAASRVGDIARAAITAWNTRTTPTTEAGVTQVEDVREIVRRYNYNPRPGRTFNGGEDGAVAAAQAYAAAVCHKATASLRAENERLLAENKRLTKLATGEWFYPADDYDGERCMWSPDEVIDSLDLDPGQHVVEVNVATPLPSIWCAVTVTADEDADERFTFTEHGTADEARATLSHTEEGRS
jgi:hypothetical protein